MLKRAVANSKDNFTYKMALASITRNLGMYGEAAEEYEELVRDYPEKEELNYYLADALTQAGEIGKAIEAYDALESVMGMNEAISMQKYKLYVQLEKPEEAFKEIDLLTGEYTLVTSYLTDTDEIEALPAEQREEVNRVAGKLAGLEQERSRYR